MSYSIKVICKSEQKASLWSGGITTQLAIYPETADYQKRDFLWRLSSAQVDVEESEFTHLPGIWRKIMIIEGQMLLEHKGQHRARLQPFEQDSFSGEWTTFSKGKVKDFNLMMADGCAGELEAIHVTKGRESQKLCIQPRGEFVQVTEAFYCVNGVLSLMIDDDEPVHIDEGEMVLVSMRNSTKQLHITFYNRNDRDGDVIRASIFYN